jgi:3,4-dihydroxy-2-butanone 4-phosphate synthase
MKEQALNVGLEALKKGQCIAILDSKYREAKTDLFFPTTFSLLFL